MIDPETIREERDQRFANDEPHESFGPEHIQQIAIANGATAESWTPSLQEDVGHRLVKKFGGPAVNQARPLLVELANSGVVNGRVNSYVAGILRSEHATRDVEKLLHAGRKRMPPPITPSPLDAVPTAVRANLLTTAEANLEERGDVPEDWRTDVLRDRFQRQITQEAERLARLSERRSA